VHHAISISVWIHVCIPETYCVFTVGSFHMLCFQSDSLLIKSIFFIIGEDCNLTAACCSQRDRETESDWASRWRLWECGMKQDVKSARFVSWWLTISDVPTDGASTTSRL